MRRRAGIDGGLAHIRRARPRSSAVCSLARKLIGRAQPCSFFGGMGLGSTPGGTPTNAVMRACCLTALLVATMHGRALAETGSLLPTTCTSCVHWLVAVPFRQLSVHGYRTTVLHTSARQLRARGPDRHAYAS